MDLGIGGIYTPTEQYFDETNQEEFAMRMMDMPLEIDSDYITTSCPLVTEVPFSISALKVINKDCYYGLLENRLNTITSEYDNLILELRESKDVYFDFQGTANKVRILKDSEVINLSFFVDGEKPSNNNEIAITEAYAKNNNLVIGNTLNLDDKDYTISGFVLFPDYSLAMFSDALIFDNETQTMGLLTDEEFENLNETVYFEIAGVFEEGYTDLDFEEDVIDDYRNNENLVFVTSTLLTINNMRSGAIYAEIEGGQNTAIILSLLIASIALLIVGIMVSKVLQSQRGAIGILKSMGYTNLEITLPYIFFIAILSFPAIIIGYFLGVLGAEPMKNIYLIVYLLPSQAVAQTLETFVIAVLVPFGFLIIVSYIIIRRILSQKPVTLLNPPITSNANFLTKRMHGFLKRLKITTKIKHLLLYRNMIKFSVFIIGMFFAAFLILLSFSMVGVMDRMLYDYYDNTDHNYIGYCDYMDICETTGTQEKVIEIPSAILDDEDIYLVGLDPDNELHKLLNKRGKEITNDLENGIIITTSLGLINGVGVGDSLLLQVGEESKEFEVVGVTEEYTGKKAYIDIEELALLLTNTTTYSNTVYSATELSEDDFLIVISTEDILQQAGIMQNLFNIMVYVMIIASVVIGSIVVYILTVMTIEDNFYNISLFKVIGYKYKEIDKMILGGYLTYGIGTFLVTIPIAYGLFYLMTYYMAQFYEILMPFRFEIWHGILSLVIFIILFFLGAYVAKRKLSKISLQEAMKMYQV
jgi:putative ABC transport system permease protein